MHHFVEFAKDHGNFIKSAASDLLSEARKGHFEGELDEDAFRKKQLTFNQCVKSFYGELIVDKDSK